MLSVVGLKAMNEKLVEQILSVNPELSRELILGRMEEEKAKTGGLILGETLLRMVAAEFGINLSQGQTEAPSLLINDLIPSLNDVTVTGRVLAVFAPRAYNGKRSGKFASLLVADSSGVLRVVAWNDQTNLIESGNVAAGQIVRFSHGYTKEGRGGEVEMHASSKCRIETDPTGVRQEDYPTIEKFITRIGEIGPDHRNRRLNVAGTVNRIYPVSIFQKQDSTSGKVMRFTIVDETGEIPVVAWNEVADELEGKLKQGLGARVVQGRVKKALTEGLEVHVDGGAYAETFAIAERLLKIAELKEGTGSVNFEAEVATKPVLREVKTSKGELVKVTSFELRDKTGKIWFSAWRSHAETTASLKLGDEVTIRNAYVRKGFSEPVEASTKDSTTISCVG